MRSSSFEVEGCSVVVVVVILDVFGLPNCEKELYREQFSKMNPPKYSEYLLCSPRCRFGNRCTVESLGLHSMQYGSLGRFTPISDQMSVFKRLTWLRVQ